ncbi:SPW repeat protein [Proteobacteria bacterium 005FR1]|nr:SPW repeat protein [Proteobacteria bacterium 005FR1]
MAEYKGRSGIVQVFSGINLLAGLWLVLAPWFLGYPRAYAAMWNDTAVGVLVLLLALIRAIAPTRFVGISRANMLLGLWLIVAPFVLDYGRGGLVFDHVATWNDIVLGIVVIVSAWLSAEVTRRAHFLGNE